MTQFHNASNNSLSIEFTLHDITHKSPKFVLLFMLAMCFDESLLSLSLRYTRGIFLVTAVQMDKTFPLLPNLSWVDVFVQFSGDISLKISNAATKATKKRSRSCEAAFEFCGTVTSVREFTWIILQFFSPNIFIFNVSCKKLVKSTTIVRNFRSINDT